MKKIMGIEGEGPKIIALFVAYLVIAYLLDKNYPSSFIIANNTGIIKVVALILGAIGVVVWLWSVALLLVNFPKGKLIQSGPYAIFSHPIYDSFSFFLLPAIALYLNSWIYFGASVVLFLGTITLGKNEEKYLSKTFGEDYSKYQERVLFKF